MMFRIFDGSIIALFVVLATLLITGGTLAIAPGIPVELAELNVFAITLIVFLLLRKRLTGAWLPAAIRSGFLKLQTAFKARPFFWLLLSCAIYLVVYVLYGYLRYATFTANAFDLGFFVQALQTTPEAGFLHSTISKGGTYLGEHFSPILVALVPLYRLFGSPVFLFVIQTAVLASGAFFVWYLARRRGLSATWSAFLGICYLLYLPVRAANAFDFREDNLFIPLLFGAIAGLEARRWWLIWLCCGFAFLTKENAPLITAMLALWILVPALTAPQRDRLRITHGIALFIVSVAVFWLVNTFLTPSFSGKEAKTLFATRLAGFGENNEAILATIFSHPLRVAGVLANNLFSKDVLRYFVTVWFPFLAFVPAAPAAALIAAAGFLINVLMGVKTVGFHYECVLVPFLFFVLITGAAQRIKGARVSGTVGALFILLGFFAFFGRSPILFLRTHIPTPQHRLIEREIKTIPSDASISAMAAIFPHVAGRTQAFLTDRAAEADYVVIDLSPELDRYAAPDIEVLPGRLLAMSFEKIVDRDGFMIFRKPANDAVKPRN